MQLRLQTQYTLSITIVIVSVAVVLAWALHAHFHRALERLEVTAVAALDHAVEAELIADGTNLGGLTAQRVANALARGDTPAIGHAVRSLYEWHHAVAYAYVVDASGRLLHTSDTPITLNQAPPADSTQISRTDQVLEISVPVRSDGTVVGAVHIAFSLAALAQERAALTQTMDTLHDGIHRNLAGSVGSLVVLLVLAGAVLAAWLASRLSRPVRALAASVSRLSYGDPTAPQVSQGSENELAQLSAAFVGLRDRLAQTMVSRDFLETIIGSMQEGLIVTGPWGEIRLVNRATCDVTGYTREELLGCEFRSLLADPNTTSGKSTLSECWFLAKDGRRLPVAISRASLSDGSASEEVAVFRDITERKRLEEELRQYRGRLEQMVAARTTELTAAIHELESFSYSVSHDLHAPLRAINGYGAALREDFSHVLDESGRFYLERIREATVRMGDLIDGMLALTRVVRTETRRACVDLGAVATEVVSELRALHPAHEVAWRVEPDLHTEGDPSLLRMLLQNLLGNAWKFTSGTSSPQVEFGRRRDQPGVFFVRDNGAGFDPIDAGRLFQPFSRLHENYPGTGIGLATAQRIVQRHGGRLWASGVPGQGATFYFTLGADALAGMPRAVGLGAEA